MTFFKGISVLGASRTGNELDSAACFTATSGGGVYVGLSRFSKVEANGAGAGGRVAAADGFWLAGIFAGGGAAVIFSEAVV